jgi:oligopeptide transport system substrate-binding protein
MKKRILALLLVMALVLSSFAGCGNNNEKATTTPGAETEEIIIGRTTLNWNIGADPKTLDPGLNGASDGGDVINQTFEGLVREKSGIVQPGIAESWEVSEDGLTVTFKLRDSKWSDGSDLTAHDFVYSWKRGMDPATASEYAWIWEYTNIVGSAEAVNGESLDNVGVKALDNNTLEVKLITRTDYIVSLLSFYHFLPVKQSSVEAKAEGAWAKDPALAVCNGPFKLTSYEIGSKLVLEKNENYWNAENVHLEKIVGQFIDSESTAYNAFNSGDLDFIPNVPAAEVPKLIAEDPKFHVYSLLGTYYYNFNMDLPQFQDPKVRRAFTLAIDREQITEILGAGQVPANGFVPPGFLDHNGDDFAEVSGDYGIPVDNSGIAEAQKLMEEAGYPNGEGFPKFTIMYNTSDSHKLVAEAVQEMFKVNLGVETDLENQEWAVFQDTRKAGDYELSRGGWLTDFMDPMGLLSIFTSANAYNDPNYNNAEYDRLLSHATKTGGKEHFETLYEAQEILMTELPVIPVYHYSDTMYVSDLLINWDRSVLGTIDFSSAYITK